MIDMDKPTAFITGGSQGIGAGIVSEMAKAGYDIAFSYKSNKDMAMEVKTKAQEIGAQVAVIQGDISSLDDIDRMFDEFFAVYGKINVLVNNAGITRFSPFLETTQEMFNELINTDLRGSYFCAQKAARNMVDNEVKGTIINITSNQQSGCWPRASVYGPTKAALNKFTSHAAMELAPHGIRVVSIAPGYTRTRHNNKNDTKVIGKKYRIPLERFCEPWEIGRACVFLSGEAGGYITGTCLEMDGGALLPVLSENTYFKNE